MDEQLNIALNDLTEIFREIKIHLAWLELEQIERANNRTCCSFRCYSTTAEDLEALIGAFLKTYHDIVDMVGKRHFRCRAAIEAWLQRIYYSFRILTVPIGL